MDRSTADVGSGGVGMDAHGGTGGATSGSGGRGSGGAAGSGAAGALGGSGGAGAAGGAGGTSLCAGVPSCTLDAVRCDSGAPQKCTADANGCPRWQAQAPCGPHQVCAQGACSCSHDVRCGVTPTEGDFCPTAGGTTFGHCAKDADACLFVTSTSNACSNANTCNASGVVATGTACGCPADGTVLGTGCSNRTAGNSLGDAVNAAILTCEVVGSCQIWKAQVNCGASGLTVGTIGGVPVCICPAAAGGSYYVDPAPAMAMFMNGPVTGAQSPPACRLPSIKEALGRIAANPGFNRVVVAHEPSSPVPAPVHLGAATGEQFPIIIPAGVTVTTADGAALNAAHYVLDVASVGSAGCPIKLEHGAVLSGVTVDASGAPGTANAGLGVDNIVSCAQEEVAQSATLDHVTVTGKDGQTGILVNGSCALTADDVAVMGADIGVEVARTATGATAAAWLTARRLGVSSNAPGATGVRVGGGLDNGSRSSAALTDAAIATRNLGLKMAGGSVTWQGGSITAGNPTTESAMGADIGGGAASFSGTVFSGGSRFTGMQLSGAAQVTLQASAAGPTRFTTTLPAGASDPSTGVVLAAGASAAALTVAGGTEISRFHNGLVVNDGSLLLQGANVSIKENRGSGVELLGRMGGVVVTLSSGTVRDNAGTGVVVRSTVPSTIQNLSITGNGRDGLDVQRTQTAAQTGYRLVFAANTVSGNAGRGVALTGQGTGPGALLGGKVGVRLERNTVASNGGVGMYVTESPDAADGDDVTEVLIDSNDVSGNLTAAATAPAAILAGGVFFARADASTRVALATFVGNRVHGNGRHEIGFDLIQDGGAAWNLSSSASAVDMATACAESAKPNRIYCYDTVLGQDLAIAVASTSIHVNANGIHFQNATPMAGRDYSLGIPDVEIGVPCAPQLCQ